MAQSPWNIVRLQLPLDAETFDGMLRADAAVSLQVAPARGHCGWSIPMCGQPACNAARN